MWEYMIADYGPNGNPEVFINEIAFQGWRLVGVVQRQGDSEAMRYFFERAKKETLPAGQIRKG